MKTEGGKPRAAARTTIAVQGARVHNLKNISLELPRDRLIVLTGLSGSGKSSLAFDTIYAEGQRRYLESLSSFAKRFVAQVTKPDVDFVFGLSPVISIEQKTLTNNPRSTVATLTDIASYLNLLFATIGLAHCPRTGEPTPSRTSSQILEAILSLPEGAEIELRAPAFAVYGEELDFVFTELRRKGCRQLIVDGRRIDLAEEVGLDESNVRDIDAVVDRFVVGRAHEKAMKAGIVNTLTFAEAQFPKTPVYAVIGGIHLFSASDESVNWTPDKFKDFGVQYFVGAHCTGINTVYAIRDRLKMSRKSAVVGAVGATFVLGEGIHPGELAQ